MRRYENGGPDNRRFWEIELDGCTIHVRFGRVGSRGGGRRMSKSFEAPAIARYDWEKRIRRKISAGFALVDAEISEPQSGAEPPLRNPELETLMVEDPDADDAILVYGDWLAERGDPRGSVILLYREMAGESDPQRYVELKRRAEEIVAANMASFFGPFSEYCDNVRIRWRLGYFDDVRVRTRGGVAMAITLGTLMEAPAALMIRVLTLEAFDVRAATAMMQRSLPALRTLDISGTPHSETPPDSAQLEPLFAGKVAPRLVRLQIQQPRDPELLIHLAASPIAAQLTHVAFSSVPIADEVATVLATDFPRLQSFALDHCSVSPQVLNEIQASITARQTRN